jgi:hypothetical protein
VLDARLLDDACERPADFDLVAFWQEWCAAAEEHRSTYPVTVRVSPEFAPWLPHYVGQALGEGDALAGPLDTEGWVTVILQFESLEEARDRLLTCGRGVEVLAPVALRHSVLDHALQTVSLYST